MIQGWLLVFYLSSGQPVEVDDFPTQHACQEAALHFDKAYAPEGRYSCLPLLDVPAVRGSEPRDHPHQTTADALSR